MGVVLTFDVINVGVGDGDARVCRTVDVWKGPGNSGQLSLSSLRGR